MEVTEKKEGHVVEAPIFQKILCVKLTSFLDRQLGKGALCAAGRQAGREAGPWGLGDNIFAHLIIRILNQ